MTSISFYCYSKESLEQVDSDSYLVLSTINNITSKEVGKEQVIHFLDTSHTLISTTDSQDTYLMLHQDNNHQITLSKTSLNKEIQNIEKDKQLVSVSESTLENLKPVELENQVVCTPERIFGKFEICRTAEQEDQVACTSERALENLKHLELEDQVA